MRFRLIDEMLYRRQYTTKEICDYVNEKMSLKDSSKMVSMRTIQNDFKSIEQLWDISIESRPNGKSRIHFYSDPDFSIRSEENPQNLDTMKVLDLMQVVDGAQHFSLLKNIIQNNSNERKIIKYDINRSVKGLELFNPIFEAINNKQVITLTYRDFGAVENRIVNLSASELRQYNKRWYVIGVQKHDDTMPTRLALDRIQEMKISKCQYQESNIDTDKFYADVYGITVDLDEPIQTVRFEVYGETAHYMETKPLHKSQRTSWQGNMMTVTLNVRLNWEIKHLLMQHADAINILEPAELRQYHISVMKSALKRYDEQDKWSGTSTQFARFLLIDSMLCKGDQTIEQILKYVNSKTSSTGSYVLTETLLEEDLRRIETVYDIKIIRRRKNKSTVLQYENPEYTLRNQPEPEKAVYNKISNLLNSIDGNDHMAIFQQMISSVKSNSTTSAIVQFDDNLNGAPIETWWQMLYKACRIKKTLKITHSDFGDPCKHITTLSPVMMKEHHERWYVIGVRSAADTVPTRIALDRIQKVSYSNTKYQEPGFSVQEYYHEYYGVTTDPSQPLQTVKFEVYGKSAHYIASKPIHRSQQASWNGGILTVTLKLRLNYEIVHTLLHYIDSIRILEPLELRKMHIEIMRKAMGRYGE